MKILLVNIHSARNAGDAVLLETSLQQLKRAFPDATITLALNDPSSYDGEHLALPSFSTWIKRYEEASAGWRSLGVLLLPIYLVTLVKLLVAWRVAGWRVGRGWFRPKSTLVQAYFDADLVVSIAGNFLYSSGTVGLPYLMAIFTLAFGHWAGKPLVMLPQTLGPIRTTRDRTLLRWIISKFALVFLRDRVSFDVLATCGADTSACRVVPDLAFGMQAGDAEAAQTLLRDYGIDVNSETPLLGVTVLNWAGLSPTFQQQAQYEAAVAAAVRHFVTEIGGRAVLFSQVQGPTSAEDDRLTAAKVYAQLADVADRVVFIWSIKAKATKWTLIY